jgi:hypothetical protein
VGTRGVGGWEKERKKKEIRRDMRGTEDERRERERE